MAHTDQDDERREQRLAEDFDVAIASEKRRLYRLAHSVLRDRGEAEAVVQNTILQAWSRWRNAPGRDDRSDWLSRICLQQCFRRRASTQPVPADQLGSAFEGLGIPRRRPGARALGAGGEPADTNLDAAYRQLPKEQRAALLLHYHHGYTIEQCSDLTGWRPRATRSRINRALLRLRKELDDA